MPDQTYKHKHFTHHRFYPWAAISLSAAFLFYKYILQVSPSVMTDHLMAEFHLDGAGLGNLAACFFYAYFITQLFVGVLLDRLSTRLLTALAIAVSALGAYLFGAAHTEFVAGTARFLMGVGSAFATVSYMKVAAIWFRQDQFAFVGGLLATAAMIGAVFGQAPLAMLVSCVGWRETMSGVGILGLLVALLFVFIVHDRPRYPNLRVAHEFKHGFTMAEFWQMLRNPQNWILTFYGGLCFSPLAVFGGLWGTPFLKVAYHLDNTQAASYVSLVFVGLAFGGPLLGLLSDRLGQRKRVMVLSSVVSLLTLLMALYGGLSLWLLAVMLFVFGFTTGAFMLSFAVARDINKLALAACAASLINSGDAILGSFTEPMIGKFLDLGWDKVTVNGVPQFSLHDFYYAFIPLPLYVLIGLVLVLFLKVR